MSQDEFISSSSNNVSSSSSSDEKESNCDCESVNIADVTYKLGTGLEISSSPKEEEAETSDSVVDALQCVISDSSPSREIIIEKVQNLTSSASGGQVTGDDNVPSSPAIQAVSSTALLRTNETTSQELKPTPKLLIQESSNKSEAGGSGRWTCESCSCINYSNNLTSCNKCLTPKLIRESEDIFSAAKFFDIYGDSNAEKNVSSTATTTTPKDPVRTGRSNNVKDLCYGGESGGGGDDLVGKCYSSSYDDYWIDPSSANGSDEKWPCPTCTFENWPASAKCSMCYTPRDVYFQRNNRQDSSNNNMENSIENNRVLSESIANSSYAQRLRNRKIETDTRWLEACRGVVVGNIAPVEEYLALGGDPARQLTDSEVAILNRPSAFDVGYTLVHLALRFQHQETLAMLLSHLDCSNSGSVVKRVPSYVAPDLDQDIRNYVMSTIRYGKGNFRCNFSSEIATFTLPAGIHELSADTRETLYDEILDHDVQKELESGQFINWSPELTVQLKSRLYALWNRSAGDCLLDSVLQATWGIFDKDNRLRQSLANSLRDSASLFYQRWRENEILLSHMLDFSLDETQCAADWDNLLSVAGQPGSSLEQLHIFALAHIFRRPIIVYSVKFVKSYLGETLGYARYEGVYLPLLWDCSLCWKWPIVLGYTRGHFSALVPEEPHSDPLLRGAAAQLDTDAVNSRCVYLPLQTVDGNLLPIHFLSQSEVGNEEIILSQWLDLCYTNSGIMVARQRIQKRPLLVDQLVEEWLNHYRTLGQMTSTPFMRQSITTCYSSDGDSDND